MGGRLIGRAARQHPDLTAARHDGPAWLPPVVLFVLAVDGVLSALAADLVGVMQGALERAVGYIKEREQFGVKVGGFQALQHIAAESLVSVEGARGCAWYGAWAVDALEPDEALLAARTAKAYASERSREVCETGIQLHGGIGMTWESPCHVFLRRALLGRQCFGDEHAQIGSISQLRNHEEEFRDDVRIR